jgi:hypothetical protein
LFCSDDCRSWPRDEKINNHGCWGKHTHIPDNDYWGICLFHVMWTIFWGAIILMWYTRNIFLLASNIFFINWTVRMSDNLPERVQILGHVHIICITVWENRIICCQLFSDLLLKSAFEQIFNVMQLILVKIKWHNLLSGNIKSKNSTIVAFHITLRFVVLCHFQQQIHFFSS